MKTKLIALLAIGLFIAAVLSVADVASFDVATPSSAQTASPRSVLIRNNIAAMLQRKAPIKVLPDIPGVPGGPSGARTATNQEAAYYAWQEFVALNWPNVPVTGSGGAGARELADTTRQFGQPPAGAPGKSYPALVWESTRHRAEIYTPPASPSASPVPTPYGYTASARAAWGYNSTPGYVYPGLTVSPAPNPTPSKAIQPGLTPFINLDEGSQIGTCEMYSGAPPQASGPLPPGPGNFVFFMAKANSTEYIYIASRGWYNSSLLKKPPRGASARGATFSNTSGFIVTQGQLPSPGALDGSKNPGNYVSFPYGTIEFKAAFRVATRNERQAYENGTPIPGGYHAAPIRYYQEVKGNSSAYTYVDTVGVLLSLHIIHKTQTAPYFIFATFEHTDNVIGPDGKPVEDANGNLQPNAFTSTRPTPVPSPYVYPSSGTAPAGKYLINATSPNVVEIPSQFNGTSVTVQQFIPSPNDPAGTTSKSQSYYQNTRDGSSSTLPAANATPTPQTYITVNRRRFTIPSQITQVNSDVHNLIRQYGYNAANNVWLNYKLVNVQWVPAGNQLQKTPGKLYGDTSGGAKPLISVESYYLSNSLVETNMILSAFSGKFANPISGTDGSSSTDGLSITDFYDSPTTYTNNNVYVNGKPQTITKNVGAPFYNVYVQGGPYNMGGCMGCHANATVGGSDASFILGHGKPFRIEGVEPSVENMLYRHSNYFDYQ